MSFNFDALQLALHIGYVYGATKPPSHASHYSPKFVAGARLPHAWIKFLRQPSLTTEISKYDSLPREPCAVTYVKELGKKELDTCQWSTLDLCGPDSWTLILGRDLPPSHVSKFRQHCGKVGIDLNVWCLGTDFDITRDNWAGDELLVSGGVLVRPDQHILMTLAIDTTGEEIIAKLNRHLGF